MDQYVEAIKYPERIVLYSLDKTETGFLIASENIEFLDIDCQPKILGQKICILLNTSSDHLRHPTDWKIFNKEFFKSLKVKSNSEYMKDAKLVRIHGLEKILITPSKNGGTKGAERGFTPLNNLVIEIDNDPQKIGEAIFAQWDKCTWTASSPK